MKPIINTILLLSIPVLAFGQINYRYNGIRSGDEIIKQQVDYKDPGREGENVIWDFSKLKSINSRYTLVYKKAYQLNDSTYKMGKDLFKVKEVDPTLLIIGIEHNTMYYFKQSEHKLEMLGHENPTTLLHNTSPKVISFFPGEYQQSQTSNYQSEGMYSKRTPFESNGSSKVTVDAFGMIILPSGDTLNHVTRIKTVEVVNETVQSKKPQSFHFTTETYKWYAQGYRYPVFESVKTYDTQDSLQTKAFRTSFFFPPQEHLYLDDDKENLAVLDSLWNMKHNKQLPTDKPVIDIKLSYNFYPNPVESQLTLDYYLESPANLQVMLFSLDGRLVNQLPLGKQDKGLHTEYIDCSSLAKGTYILNIIVNDQVIGNKLMKK